MKSIHKKILLGVLAVSFFAGMTGRFLHRSPKRQYCDFRAYHHVAQNFVLGEPLYVRQSMEVLPFKYSPFFALLVSPLGFLPLGPAATLFFIINFIATILLFFLSRKICIHGPPLPRQAFWTYFLSVMFMARFIVYVWDSGQVNIVMCVLVLTGLYLSQQRKDVAASLLLAASVLFKYMPALFLPYFIARKRWKAAFLTFLFLLVLLFLPVLAGGGGVRKNISDLAAWLPSIVNSSLDAGSYLNFKNQSLFSMVLRFTTYSAHPVNVLDLSFAQALKTSYVCAFLLYLLVLLPARSVKSSVSTGTAGRRDTTTLDYGMIFICMALFNPNGWMTNFVALAFPYVLLVSYLIRVKGRDGFVLTLVVLSFILTSWMSQDIVGNRIENLSEMFSCVTLGALFLMAALVKLKFGSMEKTNTP